MSPVLMAEPKSPQWKCEAEAGWLDEDKEKIPGAVYGEGKIHVPGEGVDRATAESEALAECQKAVGKKFRITTKCHTVKCNPLSYIGKNKCKDDSECNVDIATGRCDTDLPSNIVDDSGSYPLCGCYKRDHRCHLKWVEYVACQSDDDCWVDAVPSAHAIAKPKQLRGRGFQPCKDGESAPKCVEKRCALKKIEGVCVKGKYIAIPSAQSAEPVSCTSDDDCWVSGNHPIARPKALRGHKFRGCKDGEDEPKCIDKLCALRRLMC